MNHRTAKKLKVGLYRELGYDIEWSLTCSRKNHWETFIDLVEKHQFYFAGSITDIGGKGIIYHQNPFKFRVPLLRQFLQEVETLQLKHLKIHNPTDLNYPAKPVPSNLTLIDYLPQK